MAHQSRQMGSRRPASRGATCSVCCESRECRGLRNGPLSLQPHQAAAPRGPAFVRRATQQKTRARHGRFEQPWLVHPIRPHRESPPVRSGSRPATNLDSVVDPLGCAMPNPYTLPFAMATSIEPLQAMLFTRIRRRSSLTPSANLTSFASKGRRWPQNLKPLVRGPDPAQHSPGPTPSRCNDCHPLPAPAFCEACRRKRR
jgi:hypothetical protein